MKNDPSPLFSEQSRIFEPSNLDLPPLERGFWTDDEMFQITGAGSLLLTRELTGAKLILFSKYRKSNGRLARAWSFQNIYLATLVIEISEFTGFNQLAVIQILKSLPRQTVRHFLNIQTLLKGFQERYSLCVDGRISSEEWRTSQYWLDMLPNSLNLLVSDRTDFFLSERPNNIGDFQVTFLGQLINPDTKKPEFVPGRSSAPQRAYPAESRTEMTIHLTKLGFSFMQREIGLAVESRRIV